MFLLAGGGSLENGFSKAPPGTVRNQVLRHKMFSKNFPPNPSANFFQIWTRQVGTDPKFHPRLGKSFYDAFSDDDEGVVFVPTFSVQQHMAQNPSRQGNEKFQFVLEEIYRISKTSCGNRIYANNVSIT